MNNSTSQNIKKIYLIDDATGDVFKCPESTTVEQMRKFFYPDAKQAFAEAARRQAWAGGWPFKF